MSRLFFLLALVLGTLPPLVGWSQDAKPESEFDPFSDEAREALEAINKTEGDRPASFSTRPKSRL